MMLLIGSYARVLIGLVLLAAGVSKLADRARFATVVENYRLLPTGWSRRAAILLPAVEVAVGVALVLGIGVRVAAVAAAMLFLVFGGAISINLWRGRANLACGCFGASDSSPLKWRYVARNIALTALALLGLPQFSGSGATGEALAAPETVAMAMAAAITLGCYWLGMTSIVMLRSAGTARPRTALKL